MRTGSVDKKCFLRAIGAVLILAIACACTSAKPAAKDPFMDKWRDLAEKSKGYSPTSKRYVLEAPKAGAKQPTDADVQVETHKPLPTKLISLKMHNVDVAVLLRALARAAGQNIVVNEKVTGKTSLFIHDAPWDEVFRGILRTNGLTYTWEGTIIRILTVDDMELDLKRATHKKSLQLMGPLITRVIPIHYAEAAKLKENLATLLTKDKDQKPLGTVMADEHNNALIIQAIRRDIERMIPLIGKLDRPSVQILIEAHIVEATSDVARSLGIQWGGLLHQGSFWAGGDIYNNSVTGNALSAGGIDPTSGLAANFGAAIAGSGFNPLAIGFALESVGSSLLTAQLTALQTQGKAKILSSPSITTLDHHPAKIESGSEVPFQTVSQGEIGVEYKKAVLSLEVTPHVIEGNMIKLKISTSKDELDLVNTVSGNPIINTQKAETTVILFDGQTTVIAGLKKENRNNAEAGVPGLKDIPLLGYLFKNKTKSNNLIDILIFITPHILKEKPRASKEAGHKPPEKAAPRTSEKSTLKNQATPDDSQTAAASKPPPAEKSVPVGQPDQPAAGKPVEKPVSTQNTPPAPQRTVLMDNDEALAKKSRPPTSVHPKTPAIVAQSLAPENKTVRTTPPAEKPGYTAAATETKPPLPAASQPRSRPSPLPEKTVKPKTPASAYTIQVGAFRNRNYALERLENLRSRGYQPYLFSALDGRKHSWYTVRVGAYDNVGDAARALYALAKKQPYKAVVTRTGSLSGVKTKPPPYESRSKAVLLSNTDRDSLQLWAIRNHPNE